MGVRRSATRLAAVLALWIGMAGPASPGVYAELRGTDFEGGANRHFGAVVAGRRGTNYVYAEETGDNSVMRAHFDLEAAPTEPVYLHLEALDDDFPDGCSVRIAVNEQVIFEGKSEFSGKEWTRRRYPIPPGVLRAGTNEISVRCIEPRGVLGMPPWFAVALCAVADAGHTLRTPPRDPLKHFFVTLPRRPRPIPEPLDAGRQGPGFPVRGVKGWFWTPEQYLEIIPELPRLKLNLLMICPTSLFSGFPEWKNEWWLPIPQARKRQFREVFQACRRHSVQVLFSVHPQLSAPRPLDPASEADLDALWQHYAWAQSEGVRWFGLQFDDVSPSTAQFAFANKLLERLRRQDPGAALVFCPTWYWGDGLHPPEARAYNEQLARELHPEVLLFWTGDAVVTRRITRRCLESYRGVTRHRVIIWDNYPVNDGAATLHLGPVIGRDRDLCEVADGYLSNSMCREHQLNLLPLATIADYAYNPWEYDPARSIGQAIWHVGHTARQREALRDLVEAYPGMLLFNAGTGYNPVREQFRRITALPHAAPAARAYLRHMEAVVRRFRQAFPQRFAAEKRTLAGDLDWMRGAFADQYGE